jgi:hypothetical protein
MQVALNAPHVTWWAVRRNAPCGQVQTEFQKHMLNL